MAGLFGKCGMAAAIVALACGSAGRAEAACWQDAEAQAARVRQMQTMLMVATLRCRAAHVDIVADYDAFVTARSGGIANANETIKRHFAQAGGSQSDYDRFATSLANGFGDDETTEASCAEAATLAHAATAADDGAGLHAVAARLFPAALPGGLCAAPDAPLRVAVREEPAPVTLPADVVAALAVMARVQDAANQPAAAPAATMMASVAR